MNDQICMQIVLKNAIRLRVCMLATLTFALASYADWVSLSLGGILSPMIIYFAFTLGHTSGLIDAQVSGEFSAWLRKRKEKRESK